MSLAKYLQAIKGIDPGKIEVENVRSVLNTSRFNATLICELGVEEGLFNRKIGLVCPNEGRIIQEFDEDEEIPDHITCRLCENDEREEFEWKTADLRRIEYYTLNR